MGVLKMGLSVTRKKKNNEDNTVNCKPQFTSNGQGVL
jgi:hypothetical protein